MSFADLYKEIPLTQSAGGAFQPPRPITSYLSKNGKMVVYTFGGMSFQSGAGDNPITLTNPLPVPPPEVLRLPIFINPGNAQFQVGLCKIDTNGVINIYTTPNEGLFPDVTVVAYHPFTFSYTTA